MTPPAAPRGDAGAPPPARGFTAALAVFLGLCVPPSTAAEHSYARNGGFERGTAGWQTTTGRTDLAESARGGDCLRVSGPASARQDVFLASGTGTFTAAVDLRAEDIRPPDGGAGYAYAAVYQTDAAGKLLTFRDFALVRDRADWQRHTFTFETVAETQIVSLRFGVFNATGVAWFDNWTLVAGNRPRRLDEVSEPRSSTGSPAGVIGIFRQDGFPVTGAASSPEVLRRILSAGGADVRFLDARELADARLLRPDTFDLVVLPYGESFPAEARANMTAYLHGGGGFISTGGYAFDSLFVADGPAWVPEDEWLRQRREQALAPERSLLFDGDFERDETRRPAVNGRDMEARWYRNSESCVISSEEPVSGKHCARVRVDDPDPRGETKWDLRLPARKGHRYHVSTHVRTENVTGTGFAYAAIYQHRDDELVTHRDFAQVRGTQPWTRHEFELVPEEGVTTLYIKCGLYLAAGTAWFDDVRLSDVTGLESRPMNTSTGVPADGLNVSPHQIGAFDADFRLERVHEVRADPQQILFPDEARAGKVSGWAASGVRGNDASRWIPLLTAYDRYGRERGAVGALLLHYGGFYAGSAWAYFGVDNEDLFAAPDSPMATGLERTARFMIDGLFLRNLATDTAGVRAGETATVSVTVVNRGPKTRDAYVVLTCTAPDGSELARETKQASVTGGSEYRASCTVPVPDTLPPGLVRVEATLTADDRTVDSMETGFVHLQAAGETGSPQLSFRDNYFRLGDRPVFLFGCDNYSNVYHSTAEGPLWWAREHAACRDFGFGIYENLQYSNPGHRVAEADWRSFLAMAQLTQEHDLTFMPGLLIGHNVAISDAEIAEQSRQCAEYARRLKDTPRLLWYINGDYQLRHDDKATLKEKWNRFLQTRYGDIAALRKAWGRELPAGVDGWGSLPFPPKNTRRWDDVAYVDQMRFHVRLMTDWNRAHVNAIRAIDARCPITSEYYSTPFWGIDLRLTIDRQDVSNIGFFAEPVTDIDVLPLRIRWNDLRARGKSVSLGEYGVKTHPAWTTDNGGRGYHIVRTREQQKQLFMAVAHYAFGMGASKVQNWCLRDANQRVFPWGVFYPGPLVPKDVAYVHRNLSLLMRLFAPVYEPSPVTVLLCDNMRLGNHEELGRTLGHQSFEALLGLRVDFNVVSDWFAGHLPPSTQLMIYPSALCPGDESFAAVLEWVRQGGSLLLTGDCGYGPDRRHNRPQRLRELAGVEWLETNYPPEQRQKQESERLVSATPNVPSGWSAAPLAKVRPAAARVLAATGAGAPVLTTHGVGKGTVAFFADPVELSDDLAQTRRLYHWFLERHGVSRASISPYDPEIHVLNQRTRTGRAHVLFSRHKEGTRRAVTVRTAAGNVQLGVRDRYPAIAGVADDGRLLVLGGDGRCGAEDAVLLEAEGMATLAALDGKDLRQSRAVVLLPFDEGTVRLRTSQPWRRPVVLLGDVHDGLFRELERLTPAPGREVSVDFDADRSTLVGLACEQGTERRWTELVRTLVIRPDRFPGY